MEGRASCGTHGLVFGAARGTPGETSFWRNGTPMMLMMPGAGAGGGGWVTCSGK